MGYWVYLGLLVLVASGCETVSFLPRNSALTIAASIFGNKSSKLDLKTSHIFLIQDQHLNAIQIISQTSWAGGDSNAFACGKLPNQNSSIMTTFSFNSYYNIEHLFSITPVTKEANNYLRFTNGVRPFWFISIFVITFSSFEQSNDQRPLNRNWQIADIIFVDERNSCKRPYAFALRR